MNLFIKYLILLIISILLSGCDMIVPPDKEPLDTRLLPDNYSWKYFDLLEYEYIGVPRVDCGKISSAFTKYGACTPAKTVVGNIIRCPLKEPFELFEFGCLTLDEVPAVYVRFKYQDQAKEVAFPKLRGGCEIAGAGPAAGEEPRYPGDIGYKACLFRGDKGLTQGRKSSEDENQRPIGLFADFTKNPESLETINYMITQGKFNAPMTLTLDARYFNDEDRITAYNSLAEVFEIYRSYALPPELLQEGTQPQNPVNN